MRISDWSSDVCSSDLALRPRNLTLEAWLKPDEGGGTYQGALFKASSSAWTDGYGLVRVGDSIRFFIDNWTETYVEAPLAIGSWQQRSEEHTSELQSLMRISYAVFCLKKKKTRSAETQDRRPT